MKKLMILVMTAMTTMTASAQIEDGNWYITPKAGVSVADMTSALFDSKQAGVDYNADLKPFVSFAAGVDFEYAMADQLGLAFGLSYARQGCKTKDDQFKIKLDYLPPQKIQESVLDSEVDLGITSYPVASLDIDVIPLRAEEMAVVLPAEHPLAKRTSLKMEDLNGSDFIAFGRDLVIRRETDQCMRMRDVRVNVVMEFDNVETIKEAVEIGLGVSIIPYPTVSADAGRGKIAVVPLISPRMTRPIGIIYRHHKVFSESAATTFPLAEAIPFFFW